MRKFLPAFVVLVLWNGVTAGVQPEPSGTTATADGFVLNAGGKTSWSRIFDSLAGGDDAIVVFCDCGSMSSALGQKFERPTRLGFPSTSDAARTLAAMAGYVIDTRTPGFWLLVDTTSDSCAFPFSITAVPVRQLGDTLGESRVSQLEVQRRLFRLQQDHERCVRTVSGSESSFMLYWPSREDRSVFYTLLSWKRAFRDPRYAPSATLSKISLGPNGTMAHDRLVWRVTEVGPVADVLQDFDGDGVLDIAIYSRREWSDYGVPPLRLVSGETGRIIGEIDGYHFRLLRGHDGIHVLARGTSGNSEYRIDHREDPKTLVRVSQSKGKSVFRATLASETPLDEFLISIPPINFDGRPYLDKVARVLERIGEEGSQDALGEGSRLLDWPGVASGIEKPSGASSTETRTDAKPPNRR